MWCRWLAEVGEDVALGGVVGDEGEDAQLAPALGAAAETLRRYRRATAPRHSGRRGAVRTRQALHEIGDGIVVMWWRFVDWLAVVSWKKLLLVSFLGLTLANLNHDLASRSFDTAMSGA